MGILLCKLIVEANCRSLHLNIIERQDIKDYSEVMYIKGSIFYLFLTILLIVWVLDQAIIYLLKKPYGTIIEFQSISTLIRKIWTFNSRPIYQNGSTDPRRIPKT